MRCARSRDCRATTLPDRPQNSVCAKASSSGNKSERRPDPIALPCRRSGLRGRIFDSHSQAPIFTIGENIAPWRIPSSATLSPALSSSSPSRTSDASLPVVLPFDGLQFPGRLPYSAQDVAAGRPQLSGIATGRIGAPVAPRSLMQAPKKANSCTPSAASSSR